MTLTDLPTREVAINISDAGGILRPGSVVTFRLSWPDVDDATGRAVDTQVIRVRLVEDETPVDLWPNARGVRGSHYAVSASLDGRIEEIGRISVDDIDGQTLGGLLAFGPAPPPELWWRAITQEQYDEAMAAKTDAETAAAQSEAWAESPTAPDPMQPSSKSAKTWAGEAKGHAQTAEAAQSAAKAARDASASVALVNRGWVATADDLDDITSPLVNDRAMTLDDEHVHRYTGSAWADEGASPLADKAERSQTDARSVGALPAVADTTVSGYSWILPEVADRDLLLTAVEIRSSLTGDFMLSFVRGEAGDIAVSVGETIVLTSDGSGVQAFSVSAIWPAGARVRISGSGVLRYHAGGDLGPVLTAGASGLAATTISTASARPIALRLHTADLVRSAAEPPAPDQVLGWQAAEAGGLGAASAGWYLINQVVPRDGVITSLRGFITGAAVRTIQLQVIAANAGLTAGTLKSVHAAVSAGAGWTDLTLDKPMVVAAGDVIAVNSPFIGLAAGAWVGFGPGFRNLTPATVIGGSCTIGGTSNSVFALKFRLRPREAWAGDHIPVLDTAVSFFGLSEPARLGYRTDDLDALGGASLVALADGMWVFNNTFPRDGLMTKLTAWATTVGLITIRVFAPGAGAEYNAISDTVVALAAGMNVITDLPPIHVPAGSMIGFSAPGNCVYAGVNYSGKSDQYVQTAAERTQFTLPLPWSSQTIVVGFEVSTRLDVLLAGVGGQSAGATQPVPLGSYYTDTSIQAAEAGGTVTVTVKSTLVQGGFASGAVSGTLTADAPATGRVRYDLISFDRATKALVLTQGTDRATDALHFRPATPAGHVALAYLRHNMSAASAYSFVFMPVGDVRDGEIVTLAPALATARARNRRLLRQTVQKIVAGQPLRILGHGDSIMAMQGSGAGASNTNIGRDQATAAYFPGGGRYGDDVRAAIPKYTLAQLGRGSDGAGAVYTRISAVWEMVAALEAEWGYTLGTDLHYDNISYGGWGTANAIDSNGDPLAWMTHALSVTCDLVVIALGMNERGDTGTEARLTRMVELYRAAGREVLLAPCMRPRSGAEGAWLYTNRTIEAVALNQNVALVPLDAVMTGDRFRATGVSLSDVCAANTTNHPGLEELAAYGREYYRALGL